MTTALRQPTLFLPHGGGPCFWVTMPPPFGPQAWDRLKTHLSDVLSTLPERPKAILVVSAHWEEAQPTVSMSAAPPMLFDYFGFPEHTYRLQYPAPGSPALGAKVRDLLEENGISSGIDADRGFDHGVFVPFLIVDPDAQIPVVMLSLDKKLDPSLHIAIGEAISPLRDEGVLIVGSGMSYHNLRQFAANDAANSAAFDEWLGTAVTSPTASERNEKLARWDEAPAARSCHPREEHLMPLMVVAGAAKDDVGRRDFHDIIAGKMVSGFAFG